MIKPPYTKWINDIKTKLGFNRTMTASGADVVDAVNKQAQQIDNIISSLNGFKIQYGGVSPSNWDNLFSSNKSITFYNVSGSLGIGAPSGAYLYGLLIVISIDNGDIFWINKMIYIPDTYDTLNKIYVKTKSRSQWLELSGTIINAVA